MSTVSAGKLGEDAALALLKKNGYKILGKNFRSRFGEIDIIAIEAKTLVFIEVKTRWNREYGLPEEAVTAWKLSKLIRTSQYYKLLYPKTPDLQRIDVVAVEVEGQKVSAARIIKNVTV